MKKFSLFAIGCLLFVVCAADAADSGRTGIMTGAVVSAGARPTIAAQRMPTMSISIPQPQPGTTGGGSSGGTGGGGGTGGNGNGGSGTEEGNGSKCREAYRQCMDDFCLLDESEGLRCACSDKINASRPLINEIREIQKRAEEKYTTGVEREKLGARAMIIFGSGAKSKSRGIDWNTWMNMGTDMSLDTDEDIGDNLYYMASDGCKARLKACGPDADMEENLYTRLIANDCTRFGNFLNDQKKIALDNEAAAEKAVRAARASMLAETNKYNRGECLLAFKSCIANKGGCGENFENCLDASLLARRANACDNILDQCMYTRDLVLEDWAAESKRVLADAAKYADANKRNTCLSRIRVCLEDNCGASYEIKTATDSACLTNVNIAAGICPVINECNTLVPGLKTVVGNQLGYLRQQFCQNDVDKCLQNNCGANFTAPECFGKNTNDIIALCPQDMFPSCKNVTQFDVIVTAAMWQIDNQMLTTCVNYFSEQLGRMCGLDMTCLPEIPEISLAKSVADVNALKAYADGDSGRQRYQELAAAGVDEFFKQFERDNSLRHCSATAGRNVFTLAKQFAYIGAENRAARAMTIRIAELSRKEDTEAARKNCNAMKNNDQKVTSVTFEPSLRNCHICRTEKVCDMGGESKSASAAKMAAGGAVGGASIGTMLTPGWGTVIGGVIGGVGGLIGGLSSGGEKEFCQELPVCEDVNM